MKKETTINFWGIGAQKAGTTWLHRNLAQLPEFSMPPIKELHYFDRDSIYHPSNILIDNKPIKRIANKRFRRDAKYILKDAIAKGTLISNASFYYKYFFVPYSDEWYLSLFEPYEKIKGEISPSYSILNKEDIERMYKMSSGAKIILMLRNPIDRAWSSFRFRMTKRKLSLEDVNEEMILAHIEKKGQALRSDYIRTINNFSSIFPREQTLIGFYDAIIDNPTQLLLEITQFLGADITSSIKNIDLNKRANTSKAVKCPDLIHDFLKEKHHDQIEELAKRYGGYFQKWYIDVYGEKMLNETLELSATVNM